MMLPDETPCQGEATAEWEEGWLLCVGRDPLATWPEFLAAAQRGLDWLEREMAGVQTSIVWQHHYARRADDAEFHHLYGDLSDIVIAAKALLASANAKYFSFSISQSPSTFFLGPTWHFTWDGTAEPEPEIVVIDGVTLTVPPAEEDDYRPRGGSIRWTRPPKRRRR